jgi:tetratricopeptide (TPR) repeat protein
MGRLPARLRPFVASALALEAVFFIAHFLLPGSRMFDLDLEFTIPAWFASLQLAAIGLAAFVAFEAERASEPRPALYRLWIPLGLGFLYLSADEVLALHERVLTRELHAFLPAESILQSVLPWQIVFAPAIVAAFTAIAVMVHTRFSREPVLLVLGIAGLAFWSASFVFEGAAKPLFIPAHLYPVEVALEETCEMLGGTALLAAVSAYCVLRFQRSIETVELRWTRVAGASLGFSAAAAVVIAAFTISNPAYMHRRAGDKFVEWGDYARAITAYRQAIDVSPSDADLWRRLGRAELDARHYDAAIQAYHRAIKNDPRNAVLHNDLGVAFFHAENYEGARAAYEAALAARPNYARAHRNLGVLFERLGDTRRAEAAYVEALRVDDKMVDTHRYLGNLLGREDRLGEATEHWRRSLELDPDQTAAANLRRMIEDADRSGPRVGG